jgi:TfoX/Sxy family transcriptional regulator of competence genes
MPSWSKSPQELVEVFEAVMPGFPAVARKMFGYPAGFVNGNMFMGLHEHRFVVRLPEGERAELLGLEGAETFEPMAGRPMREYVVVPATLAADPARLEPWVAKALAYAAALPPKAPRDPKSKVPKGRSQPKPTGATGTAVPPFAAKGPTHVNPTAKIPPRRIPGRQGPSRGH